MSFLYAIPPTLRLLVAFVAILVAIRRKLPLGNAFLLGAAVLGLLFGMPIAELFKTALFSFLHPKTLSLAAVISLILILSHSMEVCGQMERLLGNFRGLIRNPGLNLAVFPAIIGLLPMPGGAIFSAPMVRNLGARNDLSGAQLSYINYWFRHIWEYWWPLYPGVLLAIALADLDLWRFVLTLFPLTMVSVTVGYWSIRPVLRGMTADIRSARPPLKPFLTELAPILLVVILGIGLGTVLTPLLKPRGIDVAKELGLIVALIAGIGLVWRMNRLPAAGRRDILLRPELLRMIYIVAGILIFKGVLTESRAVDAVSGDLLGWGIPLVPVTVILPMLVGGVTGLTIAFVGATCPILISMVQAYGEESFLLAYMMLAMVSGFVGALLSPLHLCLMLSNEYFETTLIRVYRYMLIPCAALVATALLYFALLRRLMGG